MAFAFLLNYYSRRTPWEDIDTRLPILGVSRLALLESRGSWPP